MAAPTSDPIELLATQRTILAALVTDRGIVRDLDGNPVFRTGFAEHSMPALAALACDLAAALHAEAERREEQAKKQRVRLGGWA